MGLSIPVLKAIKRKGFQLPTPIQRKTIPLILQGVDVVGMAMTGSGKTGAFVVPIVHKYVRYCLCPQTRKTSSHVPYARVPLYHNWSISDQRLVPAGWQAMKPMACVQSCSPHPES